MNKPNAFFDIYKRQNIKEIGLDSLIRERDMCENIIKQQEEKKINIFDKYMEGQTDEQIKIELFKRCDIIINANRLRIDELDLEIKKFVNMNYVFESLERYFKKFGGIMSDVKYSEKKILVDLFIDSVEIDKDDDNNKVLINVGYKFDPEYIENRMKGLELKSFVKTIKKTEIDSDSSHDGGR